MEYCSQYERRGEVDDDRGGKWKVKRIDVLVLIGK
jgi:hypothetical protein